MSVSYKNRGRRSTSISRFSTPMRLGDRESWVFDVFVFNKEEDEERKKRSRVVCLLKIGRLAGFTSKETSFSVA